jgi:NADPH2:quinone reductase
MSIPTEMLAVAFQHAGDANTLIADYYPTPSLKPGHVLIKVVAAGVNRPDIMQRQGLYPAPRGMTSIFGLEISGQVVALATDVKTLTLGDSVCALVSGGGYAEYCLANAQLCLPVPAHTSLIHAAGIPETFFTVWSNLFDRAQLQKGETLLVHGGTSGIGTTAIQLAHAFNISVITTTSSDEKCHFCESLGAMAAINYQTNDFVTAVKKLTQGRGVDVILDIIGGDYLPKNIKCMAPDARLIQLAVQQHPKSEINLIPFLLKRLTLTGSTLRARNDTFKATIAQALRQQVWPLIAAKKIKPIISHQFSLDDAPAAHSCMERNDHTGKILLIP